MVVDLTAKEVKALKQACEVLDDMPTSIGDYGIDRYSFDCAVAKLSNQSLPDKSDYDDDE